MSGAAEERRKHFKVKSKIISIIAYSADTDEYVHHTESVCFYQHIVQ